jgi:anti-sigma factor RsiW
MNSLEFNRLLEARWRRPLTAEEGRELLTYLAEHPADRERWAEEVQLTRYLDELPNVPVASNFSARVLAAVAREPVRLQRPFAVDWAWLRPVSWARRAILATGILGLVVLSGRSYQWHTRVELARSVAEVSCVAALPSLELLKDYDAIQRLSQVPPAVDEELLTALQ